MIDLTKAPGRAGRSLACALGLTVASGAWAETGDRDIVVTGQRIEAPALAKLTTSLIDTPQSIAIVGSGELDLRGVDDLGDALRIVPGISLGAGETSWQGNNLILRGFTSRNDTFLDGMRDYGYYFRDPFNSASLEVLKGPGAVTFGRGATGGVLHQVSKLPTLDAVTEARIAVGTADTRRARVDVGRAIGTAAAVRLNAMSHRASVADRDGAHSERWAVAPSVGLGLRTDTRLTLSWLHQEEDNRPDYGIPWLAGRPAPVARANFYGFRDDFLDTNVDIVTARIEHDFSEAWTLRSQFRYSHADRSFRTSEAIVPPGSTGLPLGAITVTRNVFSGFSSDRFLQGQTDLLARFDTGGLSHMLVVGMETGREMPRPTYIFHRGVIPTNLARPPVQVFAQTDQYVRLRARSSADTLGFFALDTIELGTQWLAILGARWDRFSADYRSTGFDPAGTVTAKTAVDRVDRNTGLRGSLVYKPSATSSVYLGYADSFNPSAEGIESLISSGRAVGQANVDAAPEKGRMLELGGKLRVLGDRMLLTGSLFDLVKSNVRVPDPLNPSANGNGGRQRSRGIEVEATGDLTDGWSLRTSYTYLDTETTRSNNPSAGGAPRIGERLPIAPRHSGALLTHYQLTSRFGVGGGLIYQGSRLGQNTNATLLRAPGYVVFEAQAVYRISDRIEAQLNIHNLTDKLYYDQLHPFHVVPGPGRRALLTLGWKG